MDKKAHFACALCCTSGCGRALESICRAEHVTPPALLIEEVAACLSLVDFEGFWSYHNFCEPEQHYKKVC